MAEIRHKSDSLYLNLRVPRSVEDMLTPLYLFLPILHYLINFQHISGCFIFVLSYSDFKPFDV